MTKKGKFKILSYYLERNLIFYKSINKNKKIIAFALFRIESASIVLPKLFELMDNESIKYFSLQYNPTNEKILLICIESEKRANIRKLFLIIKNKLHFNDSRKILQNIELENKYTNFSEVLINNKSKMREYDEDTILFNDKQIKMASYSLNIDLIPKKKTFLNSVLKFLKNFNQNSLIIFNFKRGSNYEILFAGFLLIFMKKDFSADLFYNEMNKFFENKLIISHNLKLKDIGYILWRLPLTNSFYNYRDYCELFNNDSNELTIKHINFLDEKLVQNNIPYLKLNQNMILIKRKILFIVNNRIKVDYIKKLIDKYYSKYFIYLVIINREEYQRILNIQYICELNYLKILNYSEFYNFDYRLFKK